MTHSLSPEAILERLQKTGAAFADKKPGAREQVLNLTYALIASLELPSEAIQRMGWAEPARNAHCRIAVELNIFELLKESGATGISSVELAAKSGAHGILIARIMKHLVAMNIVGEVPDSTDSYIPTSLSNSLTEQRYRDGIVYTYDVAGPSFRGLPEYLKGIQYDLPTKLADGPFQAAHKTQPPFFAWLDAHPPYLRAFNGYMSAYRAGRLSWNDPGFYPVATQLTKRFDPAVSDVLLVDVGGGLGHDLEELKTKHPSLPGKLVLQDRDEVIATISASSHRSFETMAHDFFELQPVKGARAYYLHSVLHDWNDDDCVKILEQLKPALAPGYSTVLINEMVVPRQDPKWPITSMDQLMLVLGAMQERTEEHWELILMRAGYKIAKIYSYEMGSERLIEAELS